MKAFRTLPDSLRERISALTPIKINNIITKIHLVDYDAIKIIDTEDAKNCYAISYANILCKMTGKVTTNKFILRSSDYVVKKALNDATTYVYDSAKDQGWHNYDINYDAVIHGLLCPSVFQNMYNMNYMPEIEYASTHVMIVICDYYDRQYLGWYFFNQNLDDPINYTNFQY